MFRAYGATPTPSILELGSALTQLSTNSSSLNSLGSENNNNNNYVNSNNNNNNNNDDLLISAWNLNMLTKGKKKIQSENHSRVPVGVLRKA